MRQIDGVTMQADLWGGSHEVYVGDTQYGSGEPVAADVQVTNPVESVEQVSETDPAQMDFFNGNFRIGAGGYQIPSMNLSGVQVTQSTWNGQSEGFFTKLVRALTNAVKAVIPNAQ